MRISSVDSNVVYCWDQGNIEPGSEWYAHDPSVAITYDFFGTIYDKTGNLASLGAKTIMLVVPLG